MLPAPSTQCVLALVFGGLGSWALLFPRHVLRLGIRSIPDQPQPQRPHFDSLHILTMQCFGAQAVLNAVTLASASSLGPGFYRAFGAALVPFFGFNYYYLKVKPMFTQWMWLDAAGTAIMVAACFIGARR